MTGLLSIRGLNVTYRTARGEAKALRDIDIDIPDRGFVGLVGESGSGKSTLALALMGLLPKNAFSSVRSLTFDGKVIPDVNDPAWRAKRGTELAVVFQDPMSALNPLFRVGTQMVQVQRRKYPKFSRRQLQRRAVDMLKRVGVSSPETRLHSYPHELSGGMRQRVMIAMALLVQPRILIADEPTTALDATVEAQIAELLRRARADIDGSVVLVSHSLGLVSELCDHVVVMYAGTIVEAGPVAAVFAKPRHPYTRALLACEIDPWEAEDIDTPLVTIPGVVPDLREPPAGCIFRARCPSATSQCSQTPPANPIDAAHVSRCWLS
jgi:peptide/nickel transport system ATP-binding protein